MARLEDIIRLVSEHGKIEVNQLAKALHVSNVTIRKDLNKLEERGIITRQHGCALIDSRDNINYRLAQRHETKRRIATKAAELVNDGEIVMIESGSTCALLAEELAATRKNLTILTNSVFLTTYLRKAENLKIVLLGGEYQPHSQVNVGPLLKKVVSEFYVDKLFIGIDGFDQERGFRSNDIARSDATQTMARASQHVIVLTDASKFSQNGTVTEFALEEVSDVFTDTSIPEEARIFLENHTRLHLC